MKCCGVDGYTDYMRDTWDRRRVRPPAGSLSHSVDHRVVALLSSLLMSTYNCAIKYTYNCIILLFVLQVWVRLTLIFVFFSPWEKDLDTSPLRYRN